MRSAQVSDLLVGDVHRDCIGIVPIIRFTPQYRSAFVLMALFCFSAADAVERSLVVAFAYALKFVIAVTFNALNPLTFRETKDPGEEAHNCRLAYAGDLSDDAADYCNVLRRDNIIALLGVVRNNLDL